MNSKSDSIHCGKCFRPYDLQQRIPVSLPQCGHTCCKECADHILATQKPISSCPFCDKPFIIFLDGGDMQPNANYAILSQLEKKNAFGICQEHNIAHEYLCKDDAEHACSKCCILGKHQGHQVTELKAEQQSMLEHEDNIAFDLIDSKSCGICYRKYTFTLPPASLPQCGHTICLECSRKILSANQRTHSCPFCKKKFYVLQGGTYLLPHTNDALLNGVRETYLLGLCKQHGVPFEYFCMTERQYICTKCYVIGKHQGHQIVGLEKVKRVCDTKIRSVDEAYRSLKESLPRVHSLLEKREHEALAMTDMHFDRMDAILKKQRLEWRDKVSQLYTAEKESLTFQATMTGPLKSALGEKLAEYKLMTPKEVYFLRDEDLNEFIRKSGKDELAANIKTYSSDLSRLWEQLNYSLSEQSLKVPIFRFPEIKPVSNDPNFPLRVSKSDSTSCLCFEMIEDTLIITLRKTQETLILKADKSFGKVRTIKLHIDNLWISDSDYEVLETLMTNLSDANSRVISFGPEVRAIQGIPRKFQNEITRVLRLLFPNKSRVSRVSLAWESSHGGQIALDYLLNDILPCLSVLEEFEVNLPNTTVDSTTFRKLSSVLSKFKEALKQLSIVVQGFAINCEWANFTLNLAKLQKLFFRILKDPISQRGFGHRLCQSAKKIDTLEELDVILSFSSQEVDIALRGLFENLQKKDTLKCLTIIVATLFFENDAQRTTHSSNSANQQNIKFEVKPTHCLGGVVDSLWKMDRLEKLCIGSDLVDCQKANSSQEIKDMLINFQIMNE